MANALSVLSNKAMEDESMKGIKLNQHCSTLSHFPFADDSIFFLDGQIQEF